MKVASRANVRPDGALVISAFPLGHVLSYFKGLASSAQLSKRPQLTRLLTAFVRRDYPDCPLATIQLNRNYNAKVHACGDSHGPSMIVGFGEYTGGDLWQYDPEGTYAMEVRDTMRGYPSLRLGDRVIGGR